MNKLNPDLLSIILANLSDETINDLAATSAVLSENVKIIKNKLIFWKERTELLIGKYIIIKEDDRFNWKEIYDILLRYIGSGKYVIIPTFLEKDCIDAQNILLKYGHNRHDTDKNIIDTINREDYLQLEELLKIKPAIYNNEAFLHSISERFDSTDVFFYYGRIDFLTLDQNKLFDILLTDDDPDNQYYFSYILTDMVKKLNTDITFNNKVFFWALRHRDDPLIQYFFDTKKIDISTIDQRKIYDAITNPVEYLAYEHSEDLFMDILKNFKTNEEFNTDVFSYYIESEFTNQESLDILDWLIDFGGVGKSYRNQPKIFELLSEYEVGVKFLLKILKNPDIKFNSGQIYNALSDDTPRKFVALLLRDPRFNPKSIKNLPKYLTKYEMKSLLKDILKKFETSDNFNNDAFLHYLKSDIDMANWIFKFKNIDISTMDGYKLFNLLSKNNAINLLKNLMTKKYKYNFDLYKVYLFLDPIVSSEFVEILLRNPIFDPSLLMEAPNFLSKHNANVFLSDPKVNITSNYFLIKGYLMREYIEDSYNGLIVMHYLYSDSINMYTPSQDASDVERFYYRFLRFLVIKKPKMIDAIIWLTKNIKSYNKIVGRVISKVVNSVLSGNQYSNTDIANQDVYYAFRSFFLLAYEPRYTYKKLLDILKTEGASNAAIGMAAKIMGAKLGLDELIRDDLILTKNLQEKIDNMKYVKLSHFDYMNPNL
jgi:hypothetical protein